jgi:sugar lactone lactonase YvrE
MKTIRTILPLALASLTLTLLPACTSTGAKATATAARPFVPIKLAVLRGLAMDSADNLYVPSQKTAILYKITPAGVVTEISAKPMVELFTAAIAPDGTIYGVDSVRRTACRLDPQGAVPLADPADTNLFLGPTSLVCDAAGNVYIGENDANVIRRVTPKGEISIYAGAFMQGGSQDGKAADARFSHPRATAIDRAGNIYVGDETDFIIRKIFPDGHVTTIAGKVGEKGSQDGKGSAARFAAPRGLGCDAAGNLYVTDTPNHTIRKITPDGTVTTIAGKAGESGFVDGAIADARFNNPRAVVVDSKGNLYIGDGNNSAVRMISTDGLVTTVAGVRPSAAIGKP